jgi:hypothetical protein
MPPSGLPTGTVSSGRDGPSASHDHGHRHTRDTDPETRIAELERENEALREAVAKQRRENERIVERYERLLDCDQPERDTTDDEPAPADDGSSDALGRIARFLGL